MAIDRSQFVTAGGAAVSSLSAVFSSAVSSGSLILCLTGIWKGVGANSLSTVTDNVNTAGFASRVFSTMSNAADTSVQLIIHDKLNISSGRAGSTYRVSVNLGSGQNWNFCAMEYTGGPFTFGSTTSANGTSTGPQGAAQTASSTPVLFVSAGLYNGTGTLFNSTVVGTGSWVTTLDPSNSSAQVMNIIQSTDNSSLQQRPTHSLNVSTRWMAGTVLYTGLGAGAVNRPFVDGFPLFGCV